MGIKCDIKKDGDIDTPGIVHGYGVDGPFSSMNCLFKRGLKMGSKERSPFEWDRSFFDE